MEDPLTKARLHAALLPAHKIAPAELEALDAIAQLAVRLGRRPLFDSDAEARDLFHELGAVIEHWRSFDKVPAHDRIAHVVDDAIAARYGELSALAALEDLAAQLDARKVHSSTCAAFGERLERHREALAKERARRGAVGASLATHEQYVRE